MRIAIVGAGGIGGFLTACFERSGQPVALLARGAQLRAIRDNGLRLKEADGDVTVHPDVVTDDVAALGTPDLIVIAVKAHQLADAIAQIAPAVGPATRVVPFQNGVDAPEMLTQAFGRDRALIGVSRVLVHITGPGEVTREWDTKSFTIGAVDGTQSGVRDVIDAFRAAGVDSPDHPDVRIDLWTKFVLFNAISGVTAASRARFAALRADAAATDLVRRLMLETWEVGRASGVDLPDGLPGQMMTFFKESLPDGGWTSTAQALDEGRPLEIDHLCGAVARRGRALGVDVTASETIYALLSPWKAGAATPSNRS